MFSFHKTIDVVTLFHKANSPASIRVHTLLKQLSAQVCAAATEDQASDHSEQTKTQRSQFELDVTEEAPTEDQLRSMLEYVGVNNAGKVIKGATDEQDAIRKLRSDKNAFERPFTVDWSNGNAVAGANESEILKLIEALPKNK
ncbi:thioredoxin-like protein [Calycina marina]|uniref:Thioredoxin-like protein n=1 Tax=Calycina marina TaxID=1763456 RepID=A0A9P8CF21_9HELO|nr:thioredoxin-like protein [Calycina marina]